MSAQKKITQIQFQPWEPHNIIPNVKRGWPDPIRHIAATHVERPPALDGTLTDPIWGDANSVEPQVPFHHDIPLVSTTVYLAWDLTTLYVGIRAALPELPLSVEKGSAARYDRLSEEKVALAIDMRHNHSEMQTISINACGELEWYDDMNQMAGFSDEVGFQYYWWTLQEMNPDPAAKAREMKLRGASCAGDTQWTAELAIPLKSLNIETPIPALTMGLEVIRSATERPVESFNYHFTWMPQYPGILSSPGALSMQFVFRTRNIGNQSGIIDVQFVLK